MKKILTLAILAICTLLPAQAQIYIYSHKGSTTPFTDSKLYFSSDGKFNWSAGTANKYDSDFDISTIDSISTVEPVVMPTGISLSTNKLNLYDSDTITISATVTPDNATNKSVKWTSSNEKVATVDADGRIITLTAGTAVITATTVDGALSDTCTVTVSYFVTPGEVVDLGLSVKWASHNVGATKPEDYGGYYAWGETKEKNSYTWDNYAYKDPNSNNIFSIGHHISGTKYDAAYVNMGENWRMPTYDEMKELITFTANNCATYKGVDGFKFVGKNGNSIFLPAAGVFDLNNRPKNNSISGGYWADTEGGNSIYNEDASFFYINRYNCYYELGFWGTRCNGCSIRPVTGDIPASGISLDSTSISLQTGKAFTLASTVTPENAVNKSVSWSSSDNSVATVSSNGVVTAVSAGTATITATTSNGKYMAYCTVTVKMPSTMIVWHADGTQSRIILRTRPLVTFTDDKVNIKTETETFSYDSSDVVRFTYEGYYITKKNSSTAKTAQDNDSDNIHK